jgi:hypothetical protein
MRKQLLRFMITETTDVETGSQDRERTGAVCGGSSARWDDRSCAAAVRLRTAREKPRLDPGLCISELVPKSWTFST